MTILPRAISMRDAYFLAYLPACIGPPLIVRELLGLVVAEPGHAKLAHALEFAKKTLKFYDLKADGTYRLFHETATEHGLSIPEEPTNAGAYESFLQTARAIVQRAVAAQQDPPASAACAAGAASGDMHMSLYVGRTLFYLRVSAPDDAILATAASNVSRTLFASQKRLAEAMQKPLWPAPVVDIAKKLESLFASPPDPAKVQSSPAHEEYSEWERKVVALLDELGVTIARA